MLCLIVLLVATAWGSQQSPPKTWEYKVESGVSEKKMNELAGEGWELAETGNYGGQLAAPYVVFKRAK